MEFKFFDKWLRKQDCCRKAPEPFNENWSGQARYETSEGYPLSFSVKKEDVSKTAVEANKRLIRKYS